MVQSGCHRGLIGPNVMCLRISLLELYGIHDALVSDCSQVVCF